MSTNLPRATHNTAITEHAVVIPVGIVAIVARYVGPTNTKGSRIHVHRADESWQADTYRHVHHWDYALDTGEQYAQAVAEYVDKRAAAGNKSWRGRWVIAGGQDTYYAVKVGRLAGDE